jgi:hypothetical protein
MQIEHAGVVADFGGVHVRSCHTLPAPNQGEGTDSEAES